ncbi:TPA: hypothetical protein ACGI1V_001841 [Staphylococcus argenteus]|uniref:Uncharacterized protein n=1 Tax=Staphylococcus argenteus TaxID=985002 RepID=A0A7U7JVC5_9STAP|nr:hypothetical protein [Staphylococcus argenteus]MDR7618983.1 hypothetical protein [Staphylococcus argenteus]MDR7647239.1 hypothetical protein [Staphylococcus argenteus]MDR7652240.1 hypothetical protein [Staphylococcus argenteus]MDR7681220.1 hypothetical protein [Staphylococcus argenteus]MDT2976831.1 hypothetical protein [Staphylococcus argenteus]
MREHVVLVSQTLASKNIFKPFQLAKVNAEWFFILSAILNNQ